MFFDINYWNSLLCEICNAVIFCEKNVREEYLLTTVIWCYNNIKYNVCMVIGREVCLHLLFYNDKYGITIINNYRVISSKAIIIL